MENKVEPFVSVLKALAKDVTAKFALPASFSPEDQLKPAVASVLMAGGTALNLAVKTPTEMHVDEFAGRPDIGVFVDSLLAGYIELKAPGKGAEPKKFKGRDKQQWEKFKELPNLMYTDGNQWALYRHGERIGKVMRFDGDITSDGSKAIDSSGASALLDLLNVFLRWEPIVPSTPQALAEMIAPIARLLRSDVLAALEDPDSNLSTLAVDWRKYLFPDADNNQFADAYAQTLTYALLLAKFSGAGNVSIPQAAKAIRPGHRLVADALRILGDDAAREEIDVPITLLERVIANVNPEALSKEGGDPWLYFYEYFLAAYDPKMRKDRGVYFTPVPVVQAQVRLIAELLAEHFDAEFSFVDQKVVTLDPAAGTGTYILTAVEHALDRIAKSKGPGIRASAATTAASNMHAFEILVGPYAVAHLRLTQQILLAGGTLPVDGVHVYLTDTLESPHEVPPQLPLLYKQLGEEHKRAQKVKTDTPVLVCIGNPPYDRQVIEVENQAAEKRKGGWVRYGDEGVENKGILQDFVQPLTDLNLGVHAKNLYNDYVYFWRWALWKVFESKASPGIVSFITASSYLRGPGFAGMRKVMRETFDDLWIIDLEGDSLGARTTENVFAIRTPVAIAIGVRYAGPKPGSPATVHYTKIEGTQSEKLQKLTQIASFKDLSWRDCLTAWADPFLPVSDKPYWEWPLLTDVFPWQENGMQFKRTWPIGETASVLERRWKVLMSSPDRKTAFKETRDRKIAIRYPSLDDPNNKQIAIADLKAGTEAPAPVRVAYRSFDRHWALVDSRLGDYLRPALRRAHSHRQIYLTSLLTKVLGGGPAAVATAPIPDMDHFCQRGARDVIPLWRDTAATDANTTKGIFAVLNSEYCHSTSAEDFFAYCYAVLSTPAYVAEFWDELTIPGPRIPITKDLGLFQHAASLGRRLICLHTYGERFVPAECKTGQVPKGTARCKVGTPSNTSDYPEVFSYDEKAQELHVGKAVFDHVRPDVWAFSVSGFEVVKSWLDYRKRVRAGKKSSPLDDIRPEVWQFDEELLDLLWVLEATLDLMPEVTKTLKKIVKGEVFSAGDFPEPTDAERRGPSGGDTPLFDAAGIDVDTETDTEPD
jgi:hypothetical protein